LPIASFFCIYSPQGSVATQLRCGEIFNNHFIANWQESVLVKEFWKSVNISWKYTLCSEKNTHSYFLRFAQNFPRMFSRKQVLYWWKS